MYPIGGKMFGKCRVSNRIVFHVCSFAFAETCQSIPFDRLEETNACADGYSKQKPACAAAGQRASLPPSPEESKR